MSLLRETCYILTILVVTACSLIICPLNLCLIYVILLFTIFFHKVLILLALVAGTKCWTLLTLVKGISVNYCYWAVCRKEFFFKSWLKPILKDIKNINWYWVFKHTASEKTIYFSYITVTDQFTNCREPGHRCLRGTSCTVIFRVTD